MLENSEVSIQRRGLLRCLQILTACNSNTEHVSIIYGLYDMESSIIEEYLLQVVHMALTHPSMATRESLEHFIFFLAGQSLHVALRVSWSADCLSDFLSLCGLGDRVKNFQDNVENHAINRVCDGLRSTGSAPASCTTEVEADPSQVLRKEARLKVYNDERAFVTTLTGLSNALRSYPDREGRKVELQSRLRELNECIPNMRLIHPLGRSADCVQWIVNIIVEECTVFSSRERAPYLIRYEVIVDDTASMQDPTESSLRLPDGRFKVSSASNEVFVPQATLVEGAAAVNPLSPLAPLDTEGSAAHPKNREKGTIAGPDYLSLAFGASADERMSRIRSTSAWGAHPNWSMCAMIVKAGDNLRQEEIALQLIGIFSSIWRESNLTCSVHPYIAMPTHSDCGLMEVVDDANSIDGVKKACGACTLHEFFETAFDGSGSIAHREAQRNFVESMAGYSVVSYILQIKDRHNGNLMLSRRGELIHIDFGFIFGASPGGLNFESAPFKLTQDLVDVMGGQGSDVYNYYKILVFQALDAARECAEDILTLISLMLPHDTMPCSGADPRAIVSQVRSRFRTDLLSEAEYALYTKDLISNSLDNWRTRRYDQFQMFQNGIW